MIVRDASFLPGRGDLNLYGPGLRATARGLLCEKGDFKRVIKGPGHHLSASFIRADTIPDSTGRK